ncbi:MAG: DNA polymerase Y family protein [Terriglobales bacterium]
MPFAAIYIPDFPVEAILRAEPELRERAVAVVEGTPPLVRVVAVNERAAQAGVEPGMTKLQAEERLVAFDSKESGDSKSREKQEKASALAGEGSPGFRTREGVLRQAQDMLCAPPTGTVRQRSAEREAAAHAALLDCACGFSPRVEDTASDTVVLDLAGLERIFGVPAKIARDLARRCSEMGLETNVVVASNADTAVLASRGLAGVTVITEGKEAERLGELGIEILVTSNEEHRLGGERAPTSVESLETLERWGVRNLRALAALPEVALAERLGQEGLQLQKLARGETQRALVIVEPPLVFEEAAELEYPVDLLEPLAFLLNRMLEQLCARLSARALATNEIRLRMNLEWERDCRIDELPNCGIENESDSAIRKSDNSSIVERTLRLPVPMLDAKVFLKLMQLDLQAHPPQAPVMKVWLRAEPAEPRRAQSGLFVPQAPEAEKLEVTMARIRKVVGEGKEQNHCRLPMDDCRLSNGPEQNRQSTMDNQQCGSETRVGSAEILDTHRADGWRMKPFAAGDARANSTREGAYATTASPITALRLFRPALAAVVTMKDGQPAHVASPERPAMRGEVVWCAGPWRSSGEWWTEQAWSRQEWDVAVRNEAGVTVYRIYHDEVEWKWRVEGSYD